MSDPENIKRICDIYDWDGKKVLDCFHLGDVMYAAGLNPTKKAMMGLGQQEDLGKKTMTYEEVVGVSKKVKEQKDTQGTYHDYVEVLKLYDKHENGQMMLAELENILSNMGDEIPKECTAMLLTELADPEDDDGMFPYTPFLDRLCGKA